MDLRLVSISVVALCALSPSTPAAPPRDPLPTPLLIAKKKKGPKLEIEGGIRSVYSSNPFRYSKANVADFSAQQGPGQRFDGLESTWDVITTASLGASMEFPIAKGRKLKVGVEGQYHTFMQNPLADYPEIQAKTTYDFTRKNRGRLRLRYISDRFRKNYRLPTGLFEAARYDQLSLGLEFEREFSKAWTGGLGMEVSQRAYEDQFDSRDRDRTTAFCFGEYEVSRRTTVGMEILYGVADVDTLVLLGVPIDRSYDQWSFTPRVKTELGKWDMSFGLDYRIKSYTTSGKLDTNRFGREDTRLSARLKAERKLSKHGPEFFILLGWRESSATVGDLALPSDETSYEDYRIGVGLSYSWGARPDW